MVLKLNYVNIFKPLILFNILFKKFDYWSKVFMCVEKYFE